MKSNLAISFPTACSHYKVPVNAWQCCCSTAAVESFWTRDNSVQNPAVEQMRLEGVCGTSDSHSSYPLTENPNFCGSCSGLTKLLSEESDWAPSLVQGHLSCLHRHPHAKGKKPQVQPPQGTEILCDTPWDTQASCGLWTHRVPGADLPTGTLQPIMYSSLLKAHGNSLQCQPVKFRMLSRHLPLEKVFIFCFNWCINFVLLIQAKPKGSFLGLQVSVSALIRDLRRANSWVSLGFDFCKWRHLRWRWLMRGHSFLWQLIL